ncbi:uncharacterized protein METZ01_LOCUS233693, partial [marine metagenome]
QWWTDLRRAGGTGRAARRHRRLRRDVVRAAEICV